MSLAAIKDKLKHKPNVKERERVAVILEGERAPRPAAATTTKGTKKKTTLVTPEAKGTEPVIVAPKTVIVDKTSEGYDRDAVMKRISSRQSALARTNAIPLLEASVSDEAVPLSEKEIQAIVDPQPVGVVKEKAAETQEIDRRVPIAEETQEFDRRVPIDTETQEKKEKEILAPPMVHVPTIAAVKRRVVRKAAKQVIQPEDILEAAAEVAPGKEEKGTADALEEPVEAPKRRKRITKAPAKGVTEIGPELPIEITDKTLARRLPRKEPAVKIKAPAYFMNNREIFVNFINSVLAPYKAELDNAEEAISCDKLGKSGSDFTLLLHQQIVRDYMNLYTPYRGLLLYHGLGSGKTCTSIAIAEGMKDEKPVLIMTPASLRANYIGELKKCGDSLYKKNQYWQWVPFGDGSEQDKRVREMAKLLALPVDFLQRQKGVFFVDVSKASNYDSLSDEQKVALEAQLDRMIDQKYTFINYNGLREKRLDEMTSNYTRNLFDNKVVIIDEAHNFISRIVNKIRKEKAIPTNKRGEKSRMPYSMSVKLYEMLLSATNCRIILLSGTPVINYPNEFAILFNILRGYIKTWRIPITVKTAKKIDRTALLALFRGVKTLDYLDYSPANKVLTITRNPFGFDNIWEKNKYVGVSREKRAAAVDTEAIGEKDNTPYDDEAFERHIISILRKNDIDVTIEGMEIINNKALPDKLDEFLARYINDATKELKNVDALKRRIIGLSSYFRSAQENLLPRFSKTLGEDYFIEKIPMSDFQFKIYEAARKVERETEKKSKTPAGGDMDDLFEEKSSTYRIFSRLACNFAIPDRPMPIRKKKADEDTETEDEEAPVPAPAPTKKPRKKTAATGGAKSSEATALQEIMKEGAKLETAQDITDEREGEIEGDEVLNAIGGTTYRELLEAKIRDMEQHSQDYFSKEALRTYSPKFLQMLENITDEDYPGLHLVYSQFRTAEGIGLFTAVLRTNGFGEFRIHKTAAGRWELAIAPEDEGKPLYGLYTGTESVEEKEIMRHIYNSEWDDVPVSIAGPLRKRYESNDMGEIIKIFMITSSGSEGINLRSTQYVHLMDPYWHPVRPEQVIGRARRICSHKTLPAEYQRVIVFVYLSVFSEDQLKSDEAIELKRKDLSKIPPKRPITSDEFLFEISEIKAKLTGQLTSAVKESAFDCYLYSTDGKCMNFSTTDPDKFAYVPNYADQQNDTTARANKVVETWEGKTMKIGNTEYVYRQSGPGVYQLYDKASYLAGNPVQIGTLEMDAKGKSTMKLIGK